MDRCNQAEIRAAIGAIGKELRNLPFCCLYPRCRRQAVGSHSQQRGGALSVISENGKVYCLDGNAYRTLKDFPARDTVLQLRLTGIGEASTFPGYCSDHDRTTFSAIENDLLEPRRLDQAALLFLRSVSYEYISKLQALYYYRELLAHVGRLLPSEATEILCGLAAGVDKYRRVEGRYYLSRTFSMIRESDYTQLSVVWKTVQHTLPISLSTCMCPWIDSFYERVALGSVQPLVSATIIPGPSETHLVFSWRTEHNADAMWIQEMAQDREGLQRLLNLVVAESSDFCIRPSFWESLGHDRKERILENMRHSLFHERDNEIILIELPQ